MRDGGVDGRGPRSLAAPVVRLKGAVGEDDRELSLSAESSDIGRAIGIVVLFRPLAAPVVRLKGTVGEDDRAASTSDAG